MNHITRLQEDLARATAELAAKCERVRAFRAHLTTPKFIGYEPDGSRRDWIAIADVDAWLTEILAERGDGAPAS